MNPNEQPNEACAAIDPTKLMAVMIACAELADAHDTLRTKEPGQHYDYSLCECRCAETLRQGLAILDGQGISMRRIV